MIIDINLQKIYYNKSLCEPTIKNFKLFTNNKILNTYSRGTNTCLWFKGNNSKTFLKIYFYYKSKQVFEFSIPFFNCDIKHDILYRFFGKEKFFKKYRFDVV